MTASASATFHSEIGHGCEEAWLQKVNQFTNQI